MCISGRTRWRSRHGVWASFGHSTPSIIHYSPKYLHSSIQRILYKCTCVLSVCQGINSKYDDISDLVLKHIRLIDIRIPRGIPRNICPTVQTFNSCTSRPEVCQCLVVQIPIENMSKHKSSTPMTHVACESELRSVVRSFIHP